MSRPFESDEQLDDEFDEPLSSEPDTPDELKSRIWRETLRPPALEEATESLQLLQRHKRGERDAGQEIVLRYQEGLMRYARVLLGAQLRRHLDSGDVLNDVFLDALPRLKDFEYRGKGSVLRYLKTIARHRIQNLGQRTRTPQIDGDPTHDPFWLGLEQKGELSASEELARRELQAILDEAASRLPERERELIAARHHLGRGWAEIQAEMEYPSVAAAQMAYHRAKLDWMACAGERLRDWLHPN
ncbi:MAG: sigma-70 family RNA polymerase sigma factor [Planctomycetes bacterium]|nr:sigma-70 family RNA polymerase sigma factor [Planctomycetota bacterium]